MAIFHSSFSLSEEQKSILKNDSPRLAVLAGPGSGKTALIVEKAKTCDKAVGLAFTKAVAEEMKERCGNYSASFRTFGSLGYRYVSQFLRLAKLKSIKLLSAKEELAYFREACKYLEVVINASLKPYALRNFVHQQKSLGDYFITPAFFGEEIDEERAGALIEERISEENKGLKPYYLGAALFEMMKKRRKVLDFQDLILLPIHLKEKIGKRILDEGSSLLIDEAHDLSPAELQLAGILVDEAEEVFITASPEQAIYGALKEATPESLDAFLEQHSFEKVRLTDNFRSHPSIVKLANSIFDVSVAKRRNGKKDTIKILGPYYDQLQEANALLEAGLSEGDAILGRCNYQLIPIIVEMMRRGEPFKAKLTFNSRLAWDILEASKNVPKNSLSDLFLFQIADNLQEQGEGGVAAEENMKLMEIFTSITSYFPTVKEFISCLKHLLFSSLKGERGLSIATIHAAKGLEFNTVAMIGMEEGLLPHKLGDPSEEKRVFYVGITRAKEQLLFSWVSSKRAKPSPYLAIVSEYEQDREEAEVEERAETKTEEAWV